MHAANTNQPAAQSAQAHAFRPGAGLSGPPAPPGRQAYAGGAIKGYSVMSQPAQQPKKAVPAIHCCSTGLRDAQLGEASRVTRNELRTVQEICPWRAWPQHMDGRCDSARFDFSIRPGPKRFDRSDSTSLQGSGGTTDASLQKQRAPRCVFPAPKNASRRAVDSQGSS